MIYRSCSVAGGQLVLPQYQEYTLSRLLVYNTQNGTWKTVTVTR